MLIMLVALMGFLAVGGLGFALTGDSGGSGKAAKRAQSITGAGPGSAKERRQVDQNVVRRKQILQTIKANEKQQRRAKLTLESRIKQSGLNITVRQFWTYSLIPGAVVACAILYFHLQPLFALGGAFVAGLGLPRWVLGFLAGRRTKKFTAEFPNALDVIVRGIKSGLPVNDCLKMIARESPEPLGSEFRKLIEGASVGMSLSEGLDKLYERMPTSEVRFFGIVIAIQAKTGGNLAEALGNLSVVIRSRKLMREKIKALSGEAVASAMIIGSLPPIVMGIVALVSPGYMNVLFTDPRGHVLLLVGTVTMAFGIFVMRKMINFKF